MDICSPKRCSSAGLQISILQFRLSHVESPKKVHGHSQTDRLSGCRDFTIQKLNIAEMKTECDSMKTEWSKKTLGGDECLCLVRSCWTYRFFGLSDKNVPEGWWLSDKEKRVVLLLTDHPQSFVYCNLKWPIRVPSIPHATPEPPPFFLSLSLPSQSCFSAMIALWALMTTEANLH